MLRGPRRTICARQSGDGFRLKLNGKKRREDQRAAYFHGVRPFPTPYSPCSDNTTSMKSPFLPQWIRMRPVKARMAFTIWRETSPSGCTIGSDRTTTRLCRNAIRRVRQAGATKASAAARGRVTRSCSERRLEAAQHRISVPRRSDFDVRNHPPPPLHSSQQSSLFLVAPQPCASISPLWVCQPASTISAPSFALATR